MNLEMSHKRLVILILCILFIVVQTELGVPVECGPYELFVWCIQSNEPTCRIPRFFGAWECDGYCICQQSFVRDDEGKCIPIDKCPSPCPEASVFEQCSKSYKQLCMGQKRSVYNTCTPGCSCIPGYCWEASSKSCMKVLKYTGSPRKSEIPRIG